MVNAGTGHGALNDMVLPTIELFLNVPELKPFHTGDEYDVNVTLALVAVVTPPILPAINE